MHCNHLLLKYPAFVVDDFLDDDECNRLVEMSEAIGFRETHTDKHGEEWKDGALRTNCSTAITSKELASELQTRLRDILPECRMLNPLFRFSRFTGDQYVQPHVDGFIAAKTNHVSKYTLLFYLSDSASGQTRFIDMITMTHVDVFPKKGRLLVFDQRLCHAALPVGNEQAKYTLRTDAMYVERNEA